MTKKTLLSLTRGHPGQFEALENDFEIIRLYNERDPEAMIRENADRIQVLCSTLEPVSGKLIEALPNLEIIAVGAVGFDHIDMEVAKSRGIVVTNTPHVLTNETANLGMALLLSLSRRIVEGDAFVRAGMWRNQAFPLATTLEDKTLGIVGLGDIGRAVASRAEAFNMNIAYFGPNKKDVVYDYFSDLSELAAKSDFLMLTCPGGEATKHLIDYNILGHLGAKGFLINIARGSVVKEEDLLIALKNKTIAGAALDVYADEPNVPESLFVMDNVVLTPHIGSATRETRRKMGALVVANIKAYFAGKSLPSPVQV
ncbi:MAG: 2-hydroxyacid dehydrogenase [Alphaproteobacteria bacterium]